MSESVEQTASRLARFGDEAGPGTAYLLVVDNDSSSIFHLPHTGAIVIGRGNDVELKVQHASVSRRHAVIVHRGGRAVLLDDRSLNGIYVNGARVGESALRDGDAIVIGHVSLRYVEVTGG